MRTAPGFKTDCSLGSIVSPGGDAKKTPKDKIPSCVMAQSLARMPLRKSRLFFRHRRYNSDVQKDPYICRHCGSELRIIESSLIMRDKDELRCPVCSGLLFDWNGAVTFRAEIKRAAISETAVRQNPN